MKTVGNVIWLILAGFWSAIAWLVLAGILAVTIIGLPFARQCLKMAHFTLWPFGREAVPSPNARPLGALGNVVWAVLAGIWLAIGYVISGLLLCITVIGIPFGIQAFKFAGMSLAPFGKEIRESGTDKIAMTPNSPMIPTAHGENR